MKLRHSLALGSALVLSCVIEGDNGREVQLPPDMEVQVRQKVAEVLRAAQLPVIGARDHTFRDNKKGIVVQVSLPGHVLREQGAAKAMLYISIPGLAKDWKQVGVDASVLTSAGPEEIEYPPAQYEEHEGVFYLAHMRQVNHILDVFLYPRHDQANQAAGRALLEQQHGENFTVFVRPIKNSRDAVGEFIAPIKKVFGK